MSNPSHTARSSVLPGYYLVTDFFGLGGEVYDGWGPFPTFDLALRVRALVEALPVNKRKDRTFAIDNLGRVVDGQWTTEAKGPTSR